VNKPTSVKWLLFSLAVVLALGACTGNRGSETSGGPDSASATSSPSPSGSPSGSAGSGTVDDPFGGWVEGLPRITAPEGFNWRQFEGITLNLISENTPPSSGLAQNLHIFENATGIKVNIEQSNLEIVVEKVALDFNARNANYHIIYADPYQILAKQSAHFADLHKFNDDPTLPGIPGGLEDFIQAQLQADGYMGDDKHLYALPYDNPTMVLAYRKDVFEKYKDLFMQEKGYDWTPNPEMTWDQYYEIAAWINQKVKEGVITEVKYGTGHQAKQHDSLMNDFSNVLASFGGEYFEAENIGSIGTTNPGKSLLTSPEAIAAAEFYHKLLKQAAPGSLTWDWSGLAEAFAAGDIAMIPEWHEFSSLFENPQSSKVVGKVAWTVLPKGPKGRGNMYGGTGIGINKYAPENVQKAAWLFLVWATAPQTQYKLLEVGSTPTRYSVYELPDVKRGMEPGTEESRRMPNLLPMKAVLQAWEPGYVYMRPKIPQWPQIDTIIYTELSKMLADRQSPEETMRAIAKKSDELTGNN